MNALGVKITLEQVEKISGAGQMGRPHIARALMEAGVCPLHPGGLRYLPAQRRQGLRPQVPLPAGGGHRHDPGRPGGAGPGPPLHPEPGLGLCPEKHPGQELKGLGLAGIEAIYSEHTPEQEALYLKLAGELGLLVTGGSDFHGDNKPELTLGTMPCQPRLTYELLTALQAWRRREYGL